MLHQLLLAWCGCGCASRIPVQLASAACTGKEGGEKLCSQASARMKCSTLCLFFFFFFFLLFRATPVVYGSSQVRGQIGATVAPAQQGQIQAESATYITAHSSAGSLTH